MPGGELGDEVGGQRRGVAEGLVEGLDQPRQQLDRVRADDQLVMIGAVALGDEAGAGELVEALLLEPDREGAQGFLGVGAGEGCEAAGVDAAGEEDADRDVGDEVGADAVVEDLAQLFGELVLRAASGSRRRAPRRRGRSGGISTSPPSQASRCPGGSLRASAKIVSGAGIELKAR